MTPGRARLLAAMLAAVLGSALAVPALAQDDKRASREREALRRAQQALRSAQEQQSALQREKAELAAEKDKLDAAAKKSNAQLGALQSQAGRARADLARTEGELAQLRTELETLKRSAAERDAAQLARIDELGKALQEHQRLLAERTQTVTTTTTLLERSTQALGRAETQNGELYAISRRLLDEVRRLGGSEGLIGLDSVKLENRAEALRSEIEAQRLVVAPAR